jgi:hypothetical protein
MTFRASTEWTLPRPADAGQAVWGIIGPLAVTRSCVAATDPRMAHRRDIGDVPESGRLEVRHFFEV